MGAACVWVTTTPVARPRRRCGHCRPRAREQPRRRGPPGAGCAGRISLRPNTRRMYELQLRRYLLPHLDRSAGRADGSRPAGDVPHDQPATPGPRHAVVGDHASQHPLHVAAALDAAIREGCSPTNLARRVELPAQRRPQERILAAVNAPGQRRRCASHLRKQRSTSLIGSSGFGSFADSVRTGVDSRNTEFQAVGEDWSGLT